jgi:hypothetical protein
MNNFNHKKFFLTTLIGGLAVSALIGIVIFLIGDFGDIQVKILVTTLAVGGFSLTGLCSSTIVNRKSLEALAVAGMLISGLAFLSIFVGIWEIIEFKDIWRGSVSLSILAVTIAHISLLLLVKPKSDLIKNFLFITILFISAVAAMLIIPVIGDMEPEDFYFRLLGVFAIIDVLGTITIPILNTITTPEK